MTGQPYMAARGLELKTLAGYAYKGVDLEVSKGELFAVRGRNGSGKTALLLTLAGRMKPTGDSIFRSSVRRSGDGWGSVSSPVSTSFRRV